MVGLSPRAGSARELLVVGQGGVPLDATAVVLNVTVDGPEGSGFVTVFPCGGLLPLASNVNFVAGQTVANAVTVTVGVVGGCASSRPPRPTSSSIRTRRLPRNRSSNAQR